MTTKLHELNELGQSIWLDYIRRSMIANGELKQLINDGLRGMTSNPAIFEKAIAHSDEYDNQIRQLTQQDGIQPIDIYEAIAIQDIQNAADMLRPVYDETHGDDGYVSLEVNPNLANDAHGTIDEVKSLRQRVDRPNVMYKIPATEQGLIAIEQLTGEGVNINITLMFSLRHYNAVAEAYIKGLEIFTANGGDPSKVASVASFFVSRVDVKLDPQLEQAGRSDLMGKIGIANSKVVYRRFQEIFSTDRWQALAKAHARVQRPLWASTSTKNPDYPATMYVDALIGENTVNTLPPETLDAFREHGTVADTLTSNWEATKEQLAALTDLNINLLEVGEELQREGIDKFTKPFNALLKTIATKQTELATSR